MTDLPSPTPYELEIAQFHGIHTAYRHYIVRNPHLNLTLHEFTLLVDSHLFGDTDADQS